MGEAKRKAESALISVLIPERGRPEMLKRLVQSLIDTADGDQRYEILIAIDDDDPAWAANAVDSFEWPTGHNLNILVGPRLITLGEKLNMLAKSANGDILWFIANDYVMETHGWPAKFREAVAKLPNQIGVPFPRDALHPDHAAFPILTRKMMDAVGFLFPPWFPAWFVDTWWDQIGLLLGDRPQINVTVKAPEGRGKSHGLKDVTFWATFFNALLPFRARDALGLAKLAHGEGAPGFAHVQEQLDDRKRLCAHRTSHLEAPEFAAIWEARAESEPAPGYDKAKKYAEGMLASIQGAESKPPRVAIAVPSGRTWEGTTANCIAALAAYSASAGVNLAFLNVQSSQVTHGRNMTVKLALQEGCDYVFWIDADMKLPPDALLRLLAHDKDVVGATYNKRVQNADGSYTTLGRFVTPTVVESRGALREAELLPGGVLLVKTSVYRKLQWPWYAETYRWDGKDNLDAFKNLLAEYFMTVPPADVVDSLDTTPLGSWIKGNYRVGNGEYPMFSEDLFFCEKARRHGYRVWCDMPLTNETGHLGQIEVTCKVSEDTLHVAAE